MEQYISKSDLVSEIERIKHETNYETFTDEVLGKRYVCDRLLSFLNTIEVKEVDLEKEVDEYFDIHYNEFLYDDYLEFSKHFYELGLKVKGE